MNLSWPVCGKCREVAYFSWLGGPHQCVIPGPPPKPKRHICDAIPPPGWTEDVGWTDEGIRFNFEYQITAALEDRRMQPGCTMGWGQYYPYDHETSRALNEVARNQTSEPVAAAYEELERQLDGTHAALALEEINRVAERLWPT